MRNLLLLALLLALPASAAGPHTPVVLKAARLFDARTGKLVSPGLVVVQDGKIAATGASAALPEGAQVLDLGDATLLPGFIDAHTHITGEPGEDWRQDVIDSFQRTIPERTLEALPLARATLMAGFTTIRNLGASDFVDVGLRNGIRRGLAVGPRILTATTGLGSTGGHCDSGNSWRKGLLAEESSRGIANGPDALRAKVRENIKYGADLIKVCATGGVLSRNEDVDSPQLTQAELEAIVDEAHARKRKVAAHAHGAEGIKRAVRAGVDSIEHGSFLDDETLELMRRNGTYYVPTALALQGVKERLDKGLLPPETVKKAQAALARHRESLRKAVGRGVRIAFGTDAGVFAHGRNGEEFALLVEAGVPAAQALRAATIINAELLGLTDSLGVLEPGKLADVVAVPGDPLQDIRRTQQVFFVMKEGVVHRDDRAPAPATTGR
ncbi:amidohydrolase family protein [Archangium sp.]|uniref:metal-dependent hydrolase family protein n=1 Tax=Archangium sp. TaxID=1872627 RepID=UPI002D2D9886|nr:amidohydrolase family protein [Archangium sp.]HYO59123.1 amidohydrolase family protein [Archangium sp.]